MDVEAMKLAAAWSCLLVIGCQAASIAQNSPNSQSPQNAAQSLDLIKRQAAEARVRRQGDYNNFAKARIDTGTGTVGALQAEQNATVQEMRSAAVSDLHGHLIPLYSATDIQNVQNDYARRITDANYRASLEALRAIDASGDALRNVDDSLDGLASQFSTGADPGGIKLVPEGTNFYVRNYSSASAVNGPSTGSLPQANPPELLATQDSLLLAEKKRHGAHGNAGTLKDTSGAQSLAVRGLLLPVKVK